MFTQANKSWRRPWPVLAGVCVAAFWLAPPVCAELPMGYQLDMKVLVIGPLDDPATLDVNEGVYTDTATAILNRLGVPYDVVSNTLPLPDLEDAVIPNYGKYQGVIFALSDLRMNAYYPSTWGGYSPDAARLDQYAYKYGVRVASFYASPGHTGCLRLAGELGVDATPANALLTAAGKSALPYLKAGTSSSYPFPLKYTYIYKAPALPATAAAGGDTTPGVSVLPAKTTVTPWLTYASQPIASSCKFTEANVAVGATPRTRELLALDFGNAPYLAHSMALSYGVVDWVTKGLFLGQKHVYLDPQVDDIFLPDDEYPMVEEGDSFYDFRDTVRHQLDPSFIPTPTAPCTPTDPATGAPCAYRLTGTDFTNVYKWQTKARGNDWSGAKTVNGRTINTTNSGGSEGLRLNMVFNGVLTTVTTAQAPCGALCEPLWTSDTLTSAVRSYQSNFKWINHTWDHTLLDGVGYTPMASCLTGPLNDIATELCWNDKISSVLRLTSYDKSALVTPEISGFYNRDVLEGMWSFGTRYLVSDSSKPTPYANDTVNPGCTPNPPAVPDTTDSNVVYDAVAGTWKWRMPEPNAGKYNCMAASTNAAWIAPRYIYEVPRYATALFYNVTTPAEWTGLFNYFYGANHVLTTPFNADQTYNQIIDYVSDTLLGYMLSYDLRPLMFHSANLRSYPVSGTVQNGLGAQSLLGDLLLETLTKYNAWYQYQPVRSLNLKAEGDLMKRREIYNKAGVSAVLTGGASGTTITLRAQGVSDPVLLATGEANSVVVPITGVAVGSTPGTTSASNPESYGSLGALETISYVTVTPGTDVVLAGPIW